MIPEKIAFIFVLAFFLIVFIQSGLDKVFDYKGNLSFLNDSLGPFFSKPLITLALISVTILELISGLLCLIGIVDVIFTPTDALGEEYMSVFVDETKDMNIEEGAVEDTVVEEETVEV